MSNDLGEKTFILGFGVQKAGTSWLFKHLDERTDCYMSPIKELHYFDTVHPRPKTQKGEEKVKPDINLQGLTPLRPH